MIFSKLGTLLFSAYWYFVFLMTLVVYVPLMWAAGRRRGKMAPRDYDRYIHRVVSRFALFAVRRSGARFHLEGLERVPADEPVVFVANHQGDFDIAVFLAYLPVPHAYLAKSEILKVPLLRTWMKYMRCVFIDRKNMRQSAKAILEGVAVLKAGQSMVLFPEGTRSKSMLMGEFKPASFKLATRAGVPVVPVSISGTYLIMEANNRLIKPADVYVKFHEPIPTAGLEDLQGLPARVREIIEGGLTSGD